MTLFLILWFADICDNVHEFSTGLIACFICLAFVGILITIIAWENMEDVIKLYVKKLSKPVLIGFTITLIINLLLPSSKTVYIATGFNAIQEATHTVAESDTAKKAVELLNIKLDDYLKEAKKDK